MVLHRVEFRAHGLAREGLLQQNLETLAGAAIAYPAEYQIDPLTALVISNPAMQRGVPSGTGLALIPPC
jgi:hypothetical protein